MATFAKAAFKHSFSFNYMFKVPLGTIHKTNSLAVRCVTTSATLHGQILREEVEVMEEGELVKKEHVFVSNSKGKGRLSLLKVDVNTSMRYMESDAYHSTYGDAPVWKPYKRNFKGPRPPAKTRSKCEVGGRLSTGNPCPICRDEFLVVHRRNVKLLEQFTDPITGTIFPYSQTCVCQKQHKKLEVALLKAYDRGDMLMPVSFREYKYSTYYPQLAENQRYISQPKQSPPMPARLRHRKVYVRNEPAPDSTPREPVHAETSPGPENTGESQASAAETMGEISSENEDPDGSTKETEI